MQHDASVPSAAGAMRRGGQPDARARLVSHLLVGLAVGAVVGTRKGADSFLISGLVGVVAHELLDAPVAAIVSDLGA